MRMEAIRSDCIRKMRSAMSLTKADIDAMMPSVISTYYTGQPLVYERTGTLMTAGKTEGVNGGGMSCSMSAYMDKGTEWNTGTWSGSQIIDATNAGVLVGSGGYWDRIMQNSIMIADAHFSSVFL